MSEQTLAKTRDPPDDFVSLLTGVLQRFEHASYSCLLIWNALTLPVKAAFYLVC